MKSPLEMRKVFIGVVLTLLWICIFLFFSPTLVIDWVGDASGTLTPLKPIIELIGFIIIVFYHILYRSTPETNKLSWTAVVTLGWLSLIIFYPFRDPANTVSGAPGGAVGFFALIGGLAVVMLWVRFLSDEIVA